MTTTTTTPAAPAPSSSSSARTETRGDRWRRMPAKAKAGWFAFLFGPVFVIVLLIVAGRSFRSTTVVMNEAPDTIEVPVRSNILDVLPYPVAVGAERMIGHVACEPGEGCPDGYMLDPATSEIVSAQLAGFGLGAFDLCDVEIAFVAGGDGPDVLRAYPGRAPEDVDGVRLVDCVETPAAAAPAELPTSDAPAEATPEANGD